MRPLTITSLLCALALAGPTACGDEEAAPPARSEVAGPEADPDLPDGLGAVLLRLRSRDPVSSQWRGWLTATQRDCDDDCAEPVTARLGFAEGEALELIYLLPGTWDLELEVRDLLEVPILVGRREGLRVIAGHVTTTAIDLLPAAGGVQVHARIAPGGERFTCGEAPVVVGHLREEIPVSALMRYLEGELALTGLTGAQTVGPDGELTYHLFAELEGQDRIWHQESADPTAWPDDWEETDLECRGGHIEGVTPALGGLLALCWNRWSNRIHLSFSEDGRWWEPFSTTVVSVHTDDELRACALVVDNQFNLFCSAVDRSNDFVRDRSVRDGAGGLVHAFSPDGSSWSDLLPYDPEAPDDAHEVVFDGLHYEVPRYATIGLRSLQVIHHSGLYGLWALWEHEGGRGTLVHASSVDRRHWRFGGAQSALGLGSPTVSVGTDHTCGMTPQGTAWCGGSRTWGRLGDGSFVRESRTPVRVLGDVVWQQIDAGWQHTCGVGRDGSLWCWGYNGYGQLGDGTRDFSAEPVRVGEDVDWEVVDAGATHTCAIKRNGVLWCWGRNGMGQLGDGTREARLRPVRTTGRDRWQAVSAQYDYTCAVSGTFGRGGSLYCWGLNSSGQFGFEASREPVLGPGAVRRLLMAGWVQMAMASNHACAVTRDGELACWGRNRSGQLGDGTREDRARVEYVVDRSWVQVSTGCVHTCAVTRGGHLYCWGDGTNGALGLGTTASHLEPEYVGTGWLQVAVGCGFTCGVRRDGTVQCWGRGTHGETLQGVRGHGRMLQPARARVGEGDDAVDPHAPPPNGAVVFQVPPEGEDPARWVMLAGRGTQVRSSHGLEGMIVRVQHLTHVCVDDGEDG